MVPAFCIIGGRTTPTILATPRAPLRFSTPLVSLVGLYAISSDVKLNLSGMNVQISHDPDRQSASYDRVCSHAVSICFHAENSFEVRLSILLSVQWATEMAVGSSGSVLAKSLTFSIYVCHAGGGLIFESMQSADTSYLPLVRHISTNYYYKYISTLRVSSVRYMS